MERTVELNFTTASRFALESSTYVYLIRDFIIYMLSDFLFMVWEMLLSEFASGYALTDRG